MIACDDCRNRLTPPAPDVIQVEVSAACFGRCVVCAPKPPPTGKLMAWEVFERVLALVVDGTNVQLNGIGEPLLHPRIDDMVRAVSQRGGRPTLLTNGQLAVPIAVAALSEAGLRSIGFSIHGATTETHEALQPGLDSAQVWSNVESAVRCGLDTVIFTLPLTRNLAELGELNARAAKLGVRAVVWRRYEPPRGLPNVLDPFGTPAQAAAARELLARLRAEVEGIEVYDVSG